MAVGCNVNDLFSSYSERDIALLLNKTVKKDNEKVKLL